LCLCHQTAIQFRCKNWEDDGGKLLKRGVGNAVVECEIKLFQSYFSLCRCPPEIIYFKAYGNLPEILSKLFQMIAAAFLTRPMSLK